MFILYVGGMGLKEVALWKFLLPLAPHFSRTESNEGGVEVVMAVMRSVRFQACFECRVNRIC